MCCGRTKKAPYRCPSLSTMYFLQAATEIMNSLEISAEQFRRLADRITQLAADYLNGLDTQPIAPAISGAESLRLFDTPLPEQGLGERALDDLQSVINAGRAQNGRFFGY